MDENEKSDPDAGKNAVAELRRYEDEIAREPTHEDRQRLVSMCVAYLINLGQSGATRQIGAISDELEMLILEGVQQQQFCGRIAVELALRMKGKDVEHLDEMVSALIKALDLALRVGATTVRDSSVEGLGGLIKFFPKDADDKLPKLPKADGDEDKEQQRVDGIFFERLKRRRLMVLAVGDIGDAPAKFFKQLETPLRSMLDDIRSKHVISDQISKEAKQAASEARQAALLAEIYARADLLRTLPGLIRQAPDAKKENLRQRAVTYLSQAASLTHIAEDEDSLRIAFARYQESVFRTIDVLIKREQALKRDMHATFDAVIAYALAEIPRTLVGRATVSNAQVRSTVALIRTAARLISKDNTTSDTKSVLMTLFETLGTTPPWPNLGIIEGCYAVLPYLLKNEEHKEFALPALTKVFQRIESAPPFYDLIGIHHQLIASSCFRRVVLELIRLPEKRGLTKDEGAYAQTNLEMLLAEPKPEAMAEALRMPHATGTAVMKTSATRWMAAMITAGTAFEHDLLDCTQALFEDFNSQRTDVRLLLTRILAAELRATAQDSRRINRFKQLRSFYPNTLSEAERIEKARTLSAKLPARMAQAADPDLQDFLEHCGRGVDEQAETIADLPGHVLAMVSDKSSSRIADAIARVIDLRWRHWKKQEKQEADLARLLHQVALRGPNELIFSELLPRVEKRERKIVLLFKKHVRRIHAGASMTVQEMLGHILELRNDIKEVGTNETLGKLDAILNDYFVLFEQRESVWSTLESGKLESFLALCDDLRNATQPKDRTAESSLVDALGASAKRLRVVVVRYLALPVGEFDAREDAMHEAGALTKAMITSLHGLDERLQPPERELLIRVVARLGDLFDRTIEWYCRQPRDLKAARQPAVFFELFARPMKISYGDMFADANVLNHAKDCFLNATLKSIGFRESIEFRKIYDAAKDAPPEFRTQRQQFEQFFVAWMESELDVDMLQRQFKDRWSPPLRWIYSVATNLPGISLIIILPCVAAGMLHQSSKHEFEGIGFFLLAASVLLAAVLASITSIFKFGKPHKHYFAALLPRLARLVVVPLALTVELDHSYVFPLRASTPALLLLIGLSFLMTWFYVDGEIVSASTKRLSEWKRTAKVVSLALSQAFIIAVLLATIFGSHAHEISQMCDEDANARAKLWNIDQFPSEGGHKHPYFLGMPRDVRFEGAILGNARWPAWTSCVSQLKFTYYPTIILAWTALGLFVGVFLEGFFKGERLRVDESDEEGSSDSAGG